MKLRKYQEDCLQTIQDVFTVRNNQLIQLPTGAGKTVIFLSYAQKNSDRALVVCPTRDLIEQCKETAKLFYNPKEIFAKQGDINYRDGKLVIMTGASLNSKTFRKFYANTPFDLLIFDEAHRSHCNTYRKFLDEYLLVNPKCKLLGVTATPERYDGKSLLSLFGNLSFDRNILDLIKAGHLCDIESYRIKTGFKISLHDSTSVDFKSCVYKKLDNESRNKIIIETFISNCINKKTLIFCLSVDHSKAVSEELKRRKINSEAIYGDMSFSQRKEILHKFKLGEIQVLTNCQLLTEGFDEPSIEAIIIARPTKSKSLYCQMVGRGVRNHSGKKLCYLYELTDNAHKICTFNVLGGSENDDTTEYKQGIKLTELKKDRTEINIDKLKIEKEKINLFKSGKNYSSFLCETAALKGQKKYLDRFNIPYHEPITYIEAAFLRWLHCLDFIKKNPEIAKEYYGNNK